MYLVDFQLRRYLEGVLAEMDIICCTIYELSDLLVNQMQDKTDIRFFNGARKYAHIQTFHPKKKFGKKLNQF